MTSECEQSIGFLSWGLPALTGLVGVFIGAFLSGRQTQKLRKQSYLEKQLNELYSPLLGLRKEIVMRGKLRVKIQSTADSTWRELCEEARKTGGPEATKKLTDQRYEEFGNIINYDNKVLEEQLLPAYKQMASVIRHNLWLAEAETSEYFQILLEFIDIWDRWLDNSMPGEVWEKLNHTEEKLQPFYEHLENTHKLLTEKLASGDI